MPPLSVDSAAHSNIGAPKHRFARFRVFQGARGEWWVEKVGGEAGGVFASREAALRYAGEEAAACGASLVVEVARRATPA